jgi:hypothetical protein
MARASFGWRISPDGREGSLMAYTLDTAGLTLSAQLVDTTGVNVGGRWVGSVYQCRRCPAGRIEERKLVGIGEKKQ